MGATRHGGAPSAVHEQPTAPTAPAPTDDAHLRVIRGAPGAEEVASPSWPRARGAARRAARAAPG